MPFLGTLAAFGVSDDDCGINFDFAGAQVYLGTPIQGKKRAWSLGAGFNGSVVRYQRKDGKFVVVKTYTAPQAFEHDRGAMFLLNLLFESEIRGIKPVAIKKELPPTVIHLEDTRGETLKNFLLRLDENDRNRALETVREFFSIIRIRLNKIDSDFITRQEIRNYSDGTFDLIIRVRSEILPSEIQFGGRIVEILLNFDNIVVSEDGQLVIIDPS